MIDHNQSTLKEALQQLINTYKLNGKLTETRVVNSWEKIVGANIARYTRQVQIKGSTIFIYLSSPALKQELHYSREQIQGLVNDFAGEQVVKEVVIR